MSHVTKGLAAVVVLTALAVGVGPQRAQAKDYPDGYDPHSGLTWWEDFHYRGGQNPFGVPDNQRAFWEGYPSIYSSFYRSPAPPTYSSYYYGPVYSNLFAPASGYSYGAYSSTMPARDNRAHIRLVLPADARVWFGKAATSQTGSVRDFDSPALTPGKEYSYTVKAQWRDADGKEVTRTREVDVRANAQVTVDFTRAER